MALAIDGSSPTTVTASPGPGVTTASFTPPAGSLLLPLWAGDTANTNPGTPSITDNLGAHLTYTAGPWKSSADAPGEFGQTALWTAPVGASAAQTVTVTNGAASHTDSALCVVVITGQHASPVGASGKSGSVSAAAIAQSFTGTASGSQGFIAVLDWDALGSMTAGTGCTLIATGTIPGNVSYGFFRRTSADGTNGGTTTLNVNLPGTSTNLSWSYVEIKPAASGGTTAPPAQVIPSAAQRARANPVVVAPTIGPPQAIQVPPVAVVQNPRVRPGPAPTAVNPPFLSLPAVQPQIVLAVQARPPQPATIQISAPQVPATVGILQPVAVVIAQQFRPAVVAPVVLTPPPLPQSAAPILVAAQQFRPQAPPPVTLTPLSLPQVPAPIAVGQARTQPPLAAVITLTPGPLPQAVAPAVVVTSTWRPRPAQITVSRPTFFVIATAGIPTAPIVVVPTFAVRSAARPLVLVGVVTAAGPDIDIVVGRPRTPWTAELAPTWTATTVRSSWNTEDLEQTWTAGGLQ